MSGPGSKWQSIFSKLIHVRYLRVIRITMFVMCIRTFGEPRLVTNCHINFSADAVRRVPTPIHSTTYSFTRRKIFWFSLYVFQFLMRNSNNKAFLKFSIVWAFAKKICKLTTLILAMSLVDVRHCIKILKCIVWLGVYQFQKVKNIS